VRKAEKLEKIFAKVNKVIISNQYVSKHTVKDLDEYSTAPPDHMNSTECSGGLKETPV
jgi:hypothetical protein